MRNFTPTPKQCYFCQNSLPEVDFLDSKLLEKFTSAYAKILPTKRTGLCARHQRALAKGIKRARHLAILPFVSQR